MTKSLPGPSASQSAATIRATIAMGRLLNTWLRERLPACRPAQGEVCGISIGAVRLHAECRRSSPGGFHHWATPLTVQAANGLTEQVNDPAIVAGLMADELSRQHGSVSPEVRERLISSIQGAELHAQACLSRPVDRSPIGLEQSLWHGHPFHPFAKSIAGFSVDDVRRYAPERANGFQLRWILADPDIGISMWRDDPTQARMAELLADLSGLAERSIGRRILIPAHPWQAERLARHPIFAALVEQGRAIITPPSGTLVQPTSSVRTVFAPDANIFLKLPFEARITNFARTNPRDQIARSAAAAQALATISDQVSACGLDVLDEPGALWIDHPNLEAITGVIVRSAPTRDAFVLAGLLEPSPRDGLPTLLAMNSGLSDPDVAEDWMRAYIRVAILPSLRLFARTGISVEAHSQNSLLALDCGKPARLVLRDLEGVSIDRLRFEALTSDVKLDPAVFYAAESARQRLVYYLISNHLQHVVATIAAMADFAESALWSVVTEYLCASQEDANTGELITWLLAEETLPAKANFTSCFAGRGETPDYVRIENPLCRANQAERGALHRTVVAS